MRIRTLSNPLKPLVIAAFLAMPFASAWLWHGRNPGATHQMDNKTSPTQRLPVEIIASEDQPKWVLVPIDPS